MEPGQDPVVRSSREQISAADRLLVETVNRRLELVAQLHAYKAQQGYPPLDPEREEALLRELADSNGGPLSQEGLFELVSAVLELTKRELERRATPAL